MADFPKTVAELGPGDSLGMGLAALISGVDQYFGFDVAEHASNERNLEIFDQLVGMFERREDIPGEEEFPDVFPQLSSYRFPSELLDDRRLAASLDPKRISRIRASVMNTQSTDGEVRYVVPWDDASISIPNSVDMIFSQAVLEHVDELEAAYKAMRLWLKPDGFMSHEIDFKSHGTARHWNGHWTYPDGLWKVMRGRRPWFLNRQPHSVHIDILRRTGFKVLSDLTKRTASQVRKEEVAQSLQDILEDDLTISSGFVVSTPARVA
jgi:SAM-dependent methyltransferase